MRTASEYLASAYARLQDGPLKGCAEILRWGEVSAKVTRIGSPTRGEDTVTDSDVPERRRVLAPVEPFAGLEKGCAVELDGTFRVVTSATDNISQTGFFKIGLSDAFDKCPASYKGTRRENGSVRTIKHPLDVLALETPTIDASYDAAAPSYVQSWTVAIRRGDWPETTDPEPSDVLEIAPGGHPITLKVASATRHEGWYILHCRQRGGV